MTIDNNLDIDINLGIEMKIVYDQTANYLAEVQLIFNTAEASSSFSLQLFNGQCTFSNCVVQDLDMSTVQDGIPFILKIYRKDKKLMIDLDGENKVEMDINNLNNIQQRCHLFWGAEDIRTVNFAGKSKDVATHYRMVKEDEGDGGNNKVDIEGKLNITSSNSIDKNDKYAYCAVNVSRAVGPRCVDRARYINKRV